MVFLCIIDLYLRDWLGNLAMETTVLQFMLEGPRTCTILCFNVHTTVKYLNRNFRLVICSDTFQMLLLFLQGQGQKGKQKHITMKVVRFHNDCPFINYGCMLQKQLFRVIASLAAKERKFVPLTKPWVNEKRNLKTRSQGFKSIPSTR